MASGDRKVDARMASLSWYQNWQPDIFFISKRFNLLSLVGMLLVFFDFDFDFEFQAGLKTSWMNHVLDTLVKTSTSTSTTVSTSMSTTASFSLCRELAAEYSRLAQSPRQVRESFQFVPLIIIAFSPSPQLPSYVF